MKKLFFISLLLLFNLVPSFSHPFYFTPAPGGQIIKVLLRDRDASSITIPEKMNGKKIVGIGPLAFSGCENLTSITIPESITSIGDSAFFRCPKLTNISLPDSVTNMGISLFLDCANLTTVKLPNGLKKIGDLTFAACPRLKNLEIPDSVTSIGDNAFTTCISLSDIKFPKGLTNIGVNAFYKCTSLKKITLPEKITKINTRTFSNCTGLSDINIPDGVTTIGKNAFENCTSLKEISFPYGLKTIDENAFKGCTGLSTVIIPDSITTIADNAFSDCSSNLELIRESHAATTGSCFSISPSIAITNSHVVSDVGNYLCVNGIQYPITLLKRDTLHDLAIIKVEGYKFPFSFKVATNDSYTLGKNIYALGYPITDLLGQDIRVTNGAINAKSGLNGDKNEFQMSAAIQPGNSGGPIVYADDPSTVIGVVVAKISDKFTLREMGTVMQNVNFAIKSNIVTSEFSFYLNYEQEINTPTNLEEATLATGLIYSTGVKYEKL